MHFFCLLPAMAELQVTHYMLYLAKPLEDPASSALAANPLFQGFQVAKTCEANPNNQQLSPHTTVTTVATVTTARTPNTLNRHPAI